MKTLNYSAKVILEIFKKKVSETDRITAIKRPFTVTPAYGCIGVSVAEMFTAEGEDNLKYEYVGYGNVVFLGTINGKAPSQGLYYKNADIKKSAENLIQSLTMLNDEIKQAIESVIEDHGQPNVSQGELFFTAKSE